MVNGSELLAPLPDLRPIAHAALMGESNAIALVASEITDDIQSAAELLFSASGRVVVTGIGKSGHVGRKLAATLSSIGKPAQFVHASEASHGDLGALAPGDIVLALSNSGETPELSDFIAFCGHWDIPLVAITSNPDSSLARHAAMSLIYPRVKEVCAIGRAPTTSTTVMMAIGDAIAVVLTHLLGTTDEHFGRHHPGGSLGSRLRKVGDLMRSGDTLPVVDYSCPMHDAIIEMSHKGLGSTIVRDAKGNFAGVITDGDLRRLGPTLWSKLAGEVANFEPQSVDRDELAELALARMHEGRITSLLVTDADDEIVGLIHIHDCLRDRR